MESCISEKVNLTPVSIIEPPYPTNGTANMAAIIAIDNTLLETFRLEYEN